MIPFVQQVADELTQKPTADEAGCGPCAIGARRDRDPSLRRARCLDRRDERIDTWQAHAFHLDGRHELVIRPNLGGVLLDHREGRLA
jgi:hypothetical protein